MSHRNYWPTLDVFDMQNLACVKTQTEPAVDIFTSLCARLDGAGWQCHALAYDEEDEQIRSFQTGDPPCLAPLRFVFHATESTHANN